MDRLVFAVLSDSLAEIRRVPARCGRDVTPTRDRLQAHFTVWERGVLVNAACFLLDFPKTEIDIPLRAFHIAHQIMEAEAGYLEELAAAAMAGAPWRGFFPAVCLHCGRSGTWRQMLSVPGIAPEVGWRYERPENHIPLCRRCVSRLAYRDLAVQIDLARAVWGARFEALFAWHESLLADGIPAGWDRAAHPLWPAEFGGPLWSSGSGALEYSEPQMFYGVQRSTLHRERLAKYLGRDKAAALVSLPPSSEEESCLPVFEVPVNQRLGAAL